MGKARQPPQKMIAAAESKAVAALAKASARKRGLRRGRVLRRESEGHDAISYLWLSATLVASARGVAVAKCLALS
jgi:hypothetical protein